MLKKITAFICSFLVIILACSAAFLSSAAVSQYSVPFPAPQDFISDYGCAIVYAYHTSSNSSIQWRALYTTCSTDANCAFTYEFKGSRLTGNIGFAGTALSTTCGFITYAFNYTSGYGYFSTSLKDDIALGNGNTHSFYNTISSDWIFDYIQVYGNASIIYNSPYASVSARVVPVFNGDYNFTDIQSLFNSVNNNLNGISNDLDTVHSDLENIFSSVNNTKDTISSGFGLVNSKFTESTNKLGSIELYCRNILDELRAEDYTEPPSTTENQQMSDYEEAEQAISDDAFNNLDNFEFQGIGDSLGSFGNGFSGALSFLSSNMEYFTGNQTTSYGSSDDDSAIRKISVVILIVLSLGLVSFVLNLVSSKGD